MFCTLPSPPLPLSFPTPYRSPRGGGGPSLGQPKIFRYGSLCCCVGDCVVGHCHLHPLYSWLDILLTFAEWNLTAQPWVPKNLLAPAKPPTKKAKLPPKSAAQSIPVESGEHVQEFQVKWSRTKKFYTEPVKE